jgi:hypothetical protein
MTAVHSLTVRYDPLTIHIRKVVNLFKVEAVTESTAICGIFLTI